MTKFILLRHGQTEWNVQRLYQGQADIPLNKTGEEQIVKAGEALKDISFDVIFTSDLIRAKATALEVKKHHPNVPFFIDQRIRERSFGDYEGKPYDKDLMNPGITDDISRNPLTFKFAGGESLMDVYHRAQQFHADIQERYPKKTILVVSHGSFLTLLSTVINKEDPLNRKKYIFNNAEPVFLT